MVDEARPVRGVPEIFDPLDWDCPCAGAAVHEIEGLRPLHARVGEDNCDVAGQVAAVGVDDCL